LIASLRGYVVTISLTFLTCPLASPAQAKINPTAEIDLHTHAEWRVHAQIEFDTAGRVLILYRDKFRRSPTGNWHLIRLTGPFSGEPKREEIDFSIPQEPVDPESTRRWDSFSDRLLLSPDGSHAFAVFDGSVVTVKSGPPPLEPLEMSALTLFRLLFHSTSTHFAYWPPPISPKIQTIWPPNRLVPRVTFSFFI